MKQAQEDLKILFHQRNVLKQGVGVLKLLPGVLYAGVYHGKKEEPKIIQDVTASTVRP